MHLYTEVLFLVDLILEFSILRCSIKISNQSSRKNNKCQSLRIEAQLNYLGSWQKHVKKSCQHKFRFFVTFDFRILFVCKFSILWCSVKISHHLSWEVLIIHICVDNVLLDVYRDDIILANLFISWF